MPQSLASHNLRPLPCKFGLELLGELDFFRSREN